MSPALASMVSVAPKSLARLELERVLVDGDDAAGASDVGRVDGRQPDAAGAEHRHRGARLHLGSVGDRAVTGDHAAADQRRQVERHVRADLHQCVLVHDHLLGECRQVGELVEVLAFPRQPLGSAGRHLHFRRLADRGVAAGAELAMPAEHRQAADHVVAGLEVADIVADRLDDARRLVAQHRRQRVRVQPLDEMQVAVAQARHRGAHQHLAAPGLFDGDVLDAQGLVRGMQDGGFDDGLLRKRDGSAIGQTAAARSERHDSRKRPRCH